MKSISYPSGDSNDWYSTNITLSRRDVQEHGLAPGHWMLSTVTGNRAKNVFLDSLWRPILSHEWDGADLSGTLRTTATRYDDSNRPIFTSYPGGQTVAPTQGIYMEYDPLGRTTATKQDSEQGLLTTRIEYLPQLLRRVTNPRQQPTVTVFQAYDQPTYDQAVGIVYPEGMTTELHRDLFGALTAMKRRNGDGSV